MVEALGRQVLLLRRLRLGPLQLGDLGSGSFRELTPDEVDQLYSAAKRAEGQSQEAPRASKFVGKNTSSGKPAAKPSRFGGGLQTVGEDKPTRPSRFAAKQSPMAPQPKPKPPSPARKPAGPRKAGR